MGNFMITGSGESTSRMINMQMDNGEVKVTEVMADQLDKYGYVDPNLQIKVDYEDWKSTRPVIQLIKEKGAVIIDQEDLEELQQEREDQRGRLEKIVGAYKRLEDEHQTLVSEQKKLYDEIHNVEVIEEKWKRVVEETAEKEKEHVREQMLMEQEQKISQLQAQWLEELAKKEATEVNEDQGVGLDNNYREELVQQLEKEKVALRLQLEQEQSEKLLSLEASWRATLEENKELLAAHAKLENVEETNAGWKNLLEEAASAHIKDLQERDAKLQDTEATLNATLLEKEALRLRMEEAEVSWKAAIADVERKAQEEKEDLERQMGERLNISAETVAVELGEALQGQLAEEEDALRARLKQEKEEELAEVEAAWKATLHEVEEKAQKEKEDMQVLVGEEETLKQKMEEFENEKLKLEEEGQAKLAEVEAKWQAIFREATGKAVHIGTVDDAKAVIAEIEAGWSAKVEEKEWEHGDLVSKMEDAYLSAKSEADAKFLEQEKMVNEMLEKLEKAKSRDADVREQFTTSAAKVENQLKPLRLKEVCTVSRDAALRCYSEHSTQPLKCSDAVKNFMQCVDVERIALLQRTAASS